MAIEKGTSVEDEILVDVSIGYRVYEGEITKDKNGFRLITRRLGDLRAIAHHRSG